MCFPCFSSNKSVIKPYPNFIVSLIIYDSETKEKLGSCDVTIITDWSNDLRKHRNQQFNWVCGLFLISMHAQVMTVVL